MRQRFFGNFADEKDVIEQFNIIPEDMDGKVLTPIFEDDHLSQKPLRSGEIWLDQGRKKVTPDYNEDEEAAIADRLRQLGYLE